MSSYISILIPAFHLNISYIQEIKNFCTNKFNINESDFDLIKIKDETSNCNNYCIKFIQSSLSLSSLSELIYQKNCLQNLCDKSIETLKAITNNISELEKQINLHNTHNDLNYDSKYDYNNHNSLLIEENEKLRNLLMAQIDYSENFRIKTENIINKIKQEFKEMIKELVNQKNSKKNVTTYEKINSSKKMIKNNNLHLNNENFSNHYSNFSKYSNVNSESNVSKINNNTNTFSSFKNKSGVYNKNNKLNICK